MEYPLLDTAVVTYSTVSPRVLPISATAVMNIYKDILLACTAYKPKGQKSRFAEMPNPKVLKD